MFTDISYLIAHNPPALHYGIAVADLDGDGSYEFIVAGFGGPNRILRWTGGQLRDTISRTLADTDRRAIGLAAGDIDGDGVEELYILNTDTYAGPKHHADRLFDRQPDGHWSDLFNRPENKAIKNLAAGRSVAAIDRRGVGRYGFFVVNYARPMRLIELGPDGVLADLATSLHMDPATGGRGVLAAPLFAAHTDLLCVNEHGPNHLFRNRGDGTFEECAQRLKLDDPEEHGRGVTTLDLGGRFGVCWGNWHGPHRVMVPRPDGTWKDRATAGLAFPSAVRAVIAADFDNDGHDELFFNNLGEPNRLFRVKPNGEVDPDVTMIDPGAALEPEGLGTGAAVADIDGDGVLELLVAHGESRGEPLSLFRAAATGNGWLRIQPRTRFGAPARGAVVKAEYGGRVRMKVIDGGSGYLCQMEPVAHFGLGPERRVERVTITWPDGAFLTMDDPDVNCTYTVPYPHS